MDSAKPPPPTPADRAVLVLALILPTAITWLYFIRLNGAPAAQQQTAYSLGKIIQFALPAFWVFLIQRQRPTFISPRFWHLVLALAFGLAVALGIFALYSFVLKPLNLFDAPAQAVRAKVQSFGAASPPLFITLGLFYTVFHSLLEEYYWRWFVFGQLARGCKLPTAILISSAAFAAHHVLVLGHYFGYTGPGSLLTWLFSLAIIIGGGFWAWLYHKSNSLLAPWLSHALIDAAIFTLGYYLITA